jgi:preprotein translocase subunit Sss1
VSIPPGSGARAARLARVPRGLAFLLALVVVLAGLFLPGAIGGAIVLALAVAMAALARMTWTATPPSRRRARVVVLLALVAVAFIKVFWGAW